MANVLERKAWSRGKPDANSKVPQKQKEKYLHPDAVIWVVKSSSLKRIRDAVILFSHCTHFPYLGRKKKASKAGKLCRGCSSSTDPWDIRDDVFRGCCSPGMHQRSVCVKLRG